MKSTNLIAAMMALSFCSGIPLKLPRATTHRHGGRRFRGYGKRGYMLNGQRVYFRPACKWVPNKKGLRWEMGVCVDRKTGRPV